MKKCYVLIIGLLMTSCSSQNDKDIAVEKWEEFYYKFHKDSLFQLSRIADEFEGINFEEGEVQDINKENWTMLKNTIFEVDTTKYKIEFNKTDSLVTTRVYLEGTGIDIRSAFKLMNKKWYIVSHINNFN
jgi:hypothetical protein